MLVWILSRLGKAMRGLSSRMGAPCIPRSISSPWRMMRTLSRISRTRTMYRA